MTVTELLQMVYRKYEGDTDYPEFAEDDMQLFFALLKDSLIDWANKFPETKEGYKELSDSSTGDKQTTSGEKTIDAPTNFIRPANKIYIGDKELEYLPPQKMSLFPDDEWFSVIGKPGAYKIVINPIPTTIETVSYSYYGTLSIPTEETDEVDISRPLYSVYYILNSLYLDDPSNKDLATMYEGKMKEEFRLEKVALAKTPTGTPNRVSGLSYLRNGAGFGRLASQLERI